MPAALPAIGRFLQIGSSADRAPFPRHMASRGRVAADWKPVSMLPRQNCFPNEGGLKLPFCRYSFPTIAADIEKLHHSAAGHRRARIFADILGTRTLGAPSSGSATMLQVWVDINRRGIQKTQKDQTDLSPHRLRLLPGPKFASPSSTGSEGDRLAMVRRHSSRQPSGARERTTQPRLPSGAPLRAC